MRALQFLRGLRLRVYKSYFIFSICLNRLRTIRKSTDAVWPPKLVDLPTFESDKLSNIMKLEDIVTDLKSKSLFGQMDLDDIRTMVKNRMTQRRRESRKRSIDFTKVRYCFHFTEFIQCRFYFPCVTDV